MNVGKFWLLTFLSLVIAVLILLEIVCENQVEVLANTVGSNEARIGQARQQNEMLRQLIQQIAIASRQDPALLNLLTKRGIHLQVTNTNGAAIPENPSATAPSASTPSP